MELDENGNVPDYNQYAPALLSIANGEEKYK